MKRLALAVALTAASAAFAATVGQNAPEFSAPDTQGKAVKLSDYRGKYVVLEWVNPECPYVRRHYNSGNMPSLQKELGAKDVVWLSVNSTNQTSSEFKSPQEMAKWMSEKGATPKATLIDKDSAVGKLYNARTTPHMYVIDPQGKLIYAGAIDDSRWASESATKNAKNHVRTALGEAMAGKPVSVKATSPYGCTVKY
jgi:cytochrome oxidase Cu insertion factor (SCO1/SenC/PrrC family)